MQAPVRINAIKGRAERIGLSLTRLCEDTGHTASTIYRWLSGDCEPGLRRYDEVCDALEARLVEHEADVFDHLARLKGGEAEAA